MWLTSYIVTTRSVSAKEFRLRLAECLDEARSGESFEITRSGRPAGRLVPPALEETTSDPEADD
jgi:prevent-host-death family protein